MQEHSFSKPTVTQTQESASSEEVKSAAVGVSSTKKKSSWKKKLITIGLVLLLVLGGYGYYQLSQLQQWYADAQFAIENQEQAELSISDYVLLRLQIEEKTEYCKDFLASDAGEFGEFEFCKRYIDWSKEIQFNQKHR